MNIGCYFNEKLNSLIHITNAKKVIMMVDEKAIPMSAFYVDGADMQWIEPRRVLKDELEGVISHTGTREMRFIGWMAKYGHVDETFEMVYS